MAAGAAALGLTMAELVARTGASRATIAHYLSLGLLPAPVKTARNMAYYPPTCVEHVRMIRELQERRNLSLKAIKELLDAKGIAGMRRILAEAEATERSAHGWIGAGATVTREELLAASGLEGERLDALERMGLAVRLADGRYDAVSMDIALAVGRMREQGLSGEFGFDVGDLELYRRVLTDAVAAEIRLFNERVLGRASRRQSERLVRAALEGAEKVWIAVRRRVLLDFLAGLRGEGGRFEAPAASSAQVTRLRPTTAAHTEARSGRHTR
jgi:DNA-binding transcriptional MerR regulator